MTSHLFRAHLLNDAGQFNARNIDGLFEELALDVEHILGPSPTDREWELCQQHLEAACFYAKKAMSTQPGNQKTG